MNPDGHRVAPIVGCGVPPWLLAIARIGPRLTSGLLRTELLFNKLRKRCLAVHFDSVGRGAPFDWTEMFTGVGLAAFCCIFGAGLAGLLLQKIVPQNQRTEATQKMVQITMNVVAILAALVLGLLIASTKTSFDTRSKEIEQFSANLTLLDRELLHFGQEQKDLRALLRDFTTRKIAQTWPTDHGSQPAVDDVQTVQMLDDIEDRLRVLTPQTEIERLARSSALQLAGELKRTNRLLTVQESGRTPRPFLVVVIFWVSVLFVSYTIFAPFNATVIATMLVAALSVSIAVNLIFDMDQPFLGFVKVSSAPMEQALEKMKP